jgi:glycosyltransferase involved in cell wall biosynthesis
MKRVLLCGSHPHIFNGYSKVMYELINQISTYDDIHLTVFGFQLHKELESHIKLRKIPNNVYVYNSHKNENLNNTEKNTWKDDFGATVFRECVKLNSPDIIVIYNDPNIITKLYKEIEDIKVKKIPYLDVVYKNNRNELMKYIYEQSSDIIYFSNSWSDAYNKLHIKYFNKEKEKLILNHGLSNHLYQIDKELARQYCGFDKDTFIITNLNRNQPRKSWDICIMAYLEFLKTHMNDNILLYIGAHKQGSYNFDEMIHYESVSRNLDITKVASKIRFEDNAQELTDFEINVLYNVADIGINTCNGEGFGLCNMEQGGIGVPQIVPNIGTFKEIFPPNTSILIEPNTSLYFSNDMHSTGGRRDLCDYMDFANAIEKYYKNKDLRLEHGKNAKDYIKKNYDWKKIGQTFHDIIINN